MAKIAAAVLTLFLNIGIGIVVFFFMLIAMNGLGGNDAEKGLFVYVLLAVAILVAMSVAAYLLTRFFIRKEFRGWVAALLAVPIFSLVGGALKIA